MRHIDMYLDVVQKKKNAGGERTYQLEGRVDCLSRRVTDLSVRTGGSGEDC